MATRLSNPVPQFFDGNGEPFNSGSLVFFANGTTTPKNVFSDVGGTTSIGNSVTLDSAGAVPDFYGDGPYRVRLLDVDSVQIWERDDVLIESAQSGQYSAWDVSTTYDDQDIVQGTDLIYYKSNTGSNTGNNPVTDLVNWTQLVLLGIYNASTTYAVGDLAIGSDGFIYRSKVNSNINNEPSISTDQWGSATSSSTITTLPLDYLAGYVITADAGDTAHDINYTAGAARDSTNTADIIRSSTLIKRIDANWTEGTGGGGFPSGLSLTADTLYNVFVLLKADETQVDGGFDTSISAANLLADATDYDKFRLVGNVTTDGSSNLGTIQNEGVVISGAFRAYINTNQDIPASVDTKIQLNTEVFDIESWFDNVTNFRFTPKVAGKYMFGWNCNSNETVSSSTEWTSMIFKNGTVDSSSFATPGLINIAASNVTGLIDMNGTTDFIEFYLNHNSSSGNVMLQGSAEETFCYGFLVTEL